MSSAGYAVRSERVVERRMCWVYNFNFMLIVGCFWWQWEECWVCGRVGGACEETEGKGVLRETTPYAALGGQLICASAFVFPTTIALDFLFFVFPVSPKAII